MSGSNQSLSSRLIPRPGFIFALILAGMLFMQHIKGAYNRSATDETVVIEVHPIDKELLFTFLPLIGFALGVEIDRNRLVKGARDLLLTFAKSNESSSKTEESSTHSSINKDQ